MARVAARVTDKRVLKLIRAFLKSGVMEDGLVSPVDEGTPQGGPLSPLLSNLVLDDLDKELTRRGLRFCRYADDCNIYVRSRRAGERIKTSVSRFLTNKLRLKVNEAKSAVARPEERKFLGFSIANDGSERRIAPKALAKFKAQIREMTRRTRGFSLPQGDRGSRTIPSRVARILWLLPDPTNTHQPGGMDPPKATSVPLAAIAKRPQPLQGTAPAWPAEVPRSGCRRLADRFLAHVRTSGGPTGPAQPVFRSSRSPPPLRSCPSLTRSNRRGTDPYARWCGRGDAVRCPPIPILGHAPTSEIAHRTSLAHSAPDITRAAGDANRGRMPLAAPRRAEAAIEGQANELSRTILKTPVVPLADILRQALPPARTSVPTRGSKLTTRKARSQSACARRGSRERGRRSSRRPARGSHPRRRALGSAGS